MVSSTPELLNKAGIPSFSDKGFGGIVVKEGQVSPPTSASNIISQGIDKRIIKTGALSLVVDDTTKAVSAIRQIAEAKGGFIASSQVSDNGENGKKGSVIIRVPAAKFSETFDAIKALAQVVEVETTGGQDITQQYLDVSARLKNLRSTESQYLEILKRANTVDEILKVQERLSQVRGEIESMESQIKYLINQSDLATISVTLSEEPTVSVSLKDFRPLTIVKTSVKALLKGFIVMFNILVSLIIVGVPIGLAVLLIAWVLWRLVLVIKRRWWG